MSALHLIISTVFHGLTVASVVTKLKSVNGTQVNIKAYRLMINRTMVILGLGFHIALTSVGSVRRYSYAYQAKLEISNVSAGSIFHRLTQSRSVYIVL